LQTIKLFGATEILMMTVGVLLITALTFLLWRWPSRKRGHLARPTEPTGYGHFRRSVINRARLRCLAPAIDPKKSQ